MSVSAGCSTITTGGRHNGLVRVFGHYGIGPISWREKWIEYASSVTQDLPPISKAFDILISLESVDLAVAPAVSSNVP